MFLSGSEGLRATLGFILIAVSRGVGREILERAWICSQPFARGFASSLPGVSGEAWQLFGEEESGREQDNPTATIPKSQPGGFTHRRRGEPGGGGCSRLPTSAAEPPARAKAPAGTGSTASLNHAPA